MGNTEQNHPHRTTTTTTTQSQQPHPKKITHKRTLQIRDRQIILDYTNKIKLTIGDLASFPAGGYEGLHLWDSSIILSRYILTHRQEFINKTVIELLSGTGIASIVLKKYTKASKIAATDNKQQIIQNIIKNCNKNQINSELIIANIGWEEYPLYRSQFDFVIGADLLASCCSENTGNNGVSNNCTVEILLCVLEKLLVVKGKGMIIVSEKSNKSLEFKKFIALIDPQIFTYVKQQLVDELYAQSPLFNKVIGYEEFKEISSGRFWVLILEKIKDRNVNVIQQNLINKKQKANIEKSPINSNSNNMNNKNVSSKKQQKKIQEELDLELQQPAEPQIVKIKIKKNQDKPEYQRNKRKNIIEIIAQSENKQDNLNVVEGGEVGDKMRSRSKSNSNKGVEDAGQEIQIVNKEHQLFNQPARKFSYDRKSTHHNHNHKNQESNDQNKGSQSLNNSTQPNKNQQNLPSSQSQNKNNV